MENSNTIQWQLFGGVVLKHLSSLKYDVNGIKMLKVSWSITVNHSLLTMSRNIHFIRVSERLN